MYLRTPKRYQKQRRHLFGSTRWLWLWILTPLVALAGWTIYEYRAEIAPPIQEVMNSVMREAERGVATITAPTPLPTENPAQHLIVAADAWEQGAIEQSLREYEQVLPNVPNNVEAYERATRAMIMQGREREALEVAEQAVNANPFAASAWTARAEALNANGRQGEAIASAMQALAFDPGYARAQGVLAEAYFDNNQIARAQEAAERALEIDPDTPEAYYVLARISAESTLDFEAAGEMLERAYSLAPNMPYIGIELAVLNGLWLENVDGGFEMLQEIAEMNPGNANALYWLAWFSYALYGDPEDARDYLTRCISTNAENISCNYYMGTLLYNTGDNEGAAEQFMRVIELGTTVSRHYLSAANINITLNNCAVAVPLLRTGYDMERAEASPNQEWLALFEESIADCGASFSAVPQVASTEEAPTPEGESS